MTGCWLTLKEVALLLGCLAREAPLWRDDTPELSFFDPVLLASMGERLMHFMGVIKHNGAVEKAQAGFIALTERHAYNLTFHGILWTYCCNRDPQHVGLWASPFYSIYFKSRV